MINGNKQIKIQIALLVILLLGAGTEKMWGQKNITVQHQDGAFYSDRLPNGMQKTNTHTTTVYIKPGEEKKLEMPTYNTTATPHSYCRWYNYTWDTKSTQLSFNNKGKAYANGQFNYVTRDDGNIGTATYEAPIDFTGETVAFDASAYTDWKLSGGNLSTEPTLSYRWVFNMRPASEMADALTPMTGDKYLEDKVVYLPENPVSKNQAARVTLEYNRDNYYTYSENGKVLSTKGTETEYGPITEPELSTEEKYSEWDWNYSGKIDGKAYNCIRTGTETETETIQRNYYAYVPTYKIDGIDTNAGTVDDDRFLFIDYSKKIITVQVTYQRSITPSIGTRTKQTRNITLYGHYNRQGTITIVATRYSDWTKRNNDYTYSNGKTTTDSKTFNIARFNLKYIAESPKDYEDLEDTEPRSLKYMEDNFVLINKLDFDYDTNPATALNNAWLTPLQWDNCSYGFTSALMKGRGLRSMTSCAPEKGEYGFYKTANISGISNGTLKNIDVVGPKGDRYNVTYNYQWYNNLPGEAYQVIRDRLYYETRNKKEKKAGYFMYIDASEKPGIVAKLPLENKLCNGTKLIVSAGVCSMTEKSATSYANLNFVFKGIDREGNEVELNRYTTGDIPKLNTNGQNDGNPWYQIYYTFDYDDRIEFDRFILQVENNATSSKGGDYAIDDIRVYRSKPTVQANQILLPCGDPKASAKIKIQIGYNKLLDMLGKTGGEEPIEVKYQFMDANKTAIKGYNYHEGAQTATTPFYDYGSIWIYTDKSKMEEWTASTTGTAADLDASFEKLPTATGDDKIFAKIEHIDNDPQGQYDYIVFKTPNNSVLKYNYNYYTAVANSSGTFETSVCALISDPFIIEKPGQITVDGAAVIDGKGICFGSPITMKAVLMDRINHEPINPCSFDWFFGEGFEKISSALSHYRMEDAYPSYEGDKELELQSAKGPFTQNDYNSLKEAMDNHKLYLNRTEIVRRVMPGEIALARPIENSTGKKGDSDFSICTDEIYLDTSGETAMPDVEIGQGMKTQVVRMEQEQIETLIKDKNKTLWIPVYDFKNSDGSQKYQIVTIDSLSYKDDKTGIVYLCGTNDPHYKDIDFGKVLLPQVARLKTLHIGNSDDKYLVFSFNQNDGNFTATKDGFPMKEGFTYSLMFFYNEENRESETIKYSICNGMTSLNFCIVPRYLTWTGAKGDNWNNDGNWKRSTKEELYKDGAYTEYTEEEAKAAQGFAPMHGSLATIANAVTAPWLYELTKNTNGSLNIAVNTNHPASFTDSTDYKANAPTKEIEYELEAWSGTDDVITSTEARAHSYAGALFKGNSCRQIYFKQGAEMRNTHYLTYEKAHVEFELTNNRWYMLASPLQGVVAGDMYIPTDGGRQVTEAFEDITYKQGEINNRFDPAVYQRNWSTDNAQNFQPKIGDYNVFKQGDWSGTYNRVDEKYNAGRGFSIRPIYFESTGSGDKTIKEGHKTLFRLPKADTRYEYYAYGSNEVLDQGKGWNADQSRLDANGRLASTPGKEKVEVTLTNNHDGGGELFLAGNPFMATLNINKFLDAHKKSSSSNDQSRELKKEYILLTDQGQCYFTWNETAQRWDSSIEGIAGGTVAPLQGFFVKREQRGGEVKVTYTPDMTVAKPATGALLRSAQTRAVDDGAARLYITAERNSQQSHALIMRQFGANNNYNEKEDVATFIDSNLKDQPTLYSVAGNTVVSINKVDDRKMIPLGIYSENEEDVTLSFSGVESFNEEVALYDAKTGTRSEITGQTTFTLPGNTQGRYFICLGETEGEENASVVTAYSPDANRLVITSSQGNPLKRARIYNTLGMAIKDLTNLNSLQEEVTVPAGLYIVRIESEKENATVKVIVKDR